MKEGRHDGLKIGAEFDFVTNGLPKRASGMKFLNIVIGRKLVRVSERYSVLHIGRPLKAKKCWGFAPNASFGY